jgi:hypothetical protein
MPRIVQPGNHVRVNRGLFYHHGIYMGVREGTPVVAELAKPSEGGVVRLVTWATFTRGGAVEIVDHPNGLPLHAVVENVRRAPRWRKYDLFDWNCEHFATWCSTHVVRSEQVRTIVGGVAIALLVAIFASAANA